VPCERCGTFTQAPVKVGARELCDACASLLRNETRLYPYVYTNVVGILLNPSVAAILSALNWKRLGDRERTRNALILGVFAIAWTIVSMAFDIPYSIIFFVGVAATRIATLGLKEPLEAHWQAGGSRANRLWPVLITLGIFAVMFAGILGYFVVTGIPDEEF
jgi:hypothetical protein